MTNAKKWLAILMALMLTLGAANVLAEDGMTDDKVMCGADCMCMGGEACMKDGMCTDACMCGKDGMTDDKAMCGKDCMCMDGEACMKDGMCTDACMCGKDDMADKDMTEDDAPMFPAFEGMDLDGNPVSSELFKDNAVTVVNFWFSSCAPCIAELAELNALNETLKEKGGAVIGINADTIGGNEKMIMEAKKILEKKGAMYQNIYFPAESEAGQLTYSIMAFPTTVVVNRSGKIVGEAILGGINNDAQMKALQTLIDETLMKDMDMMKEDMMQKDGM